MLTIISTHPKNQFPVSGKQINTFSECLNLPIFIIFRPNSLYLWKLLIEYVFHGYNKVRNLFYHEISYYE